MGFYYRSFLKNRGFPQDQFEGRPVIGICNTWSELNPCNSHFRTIAEHVRYGVLDAGGFPLEFPVTSLGEATCRQLKPREQWIAIPVPAIVDQETWDRAQAQLARNAALSFRNNTKHNYLLRCLMTCATCGLAMFGRTYAARGKQPERRYYQCHGKDCILSARPAACP